jgi:aryl-alcohol dehydrogenase-like predicted oxidoreductase
MNMEYRHLGTSGLKISALSFGAWVTFGNQIGDPVARKLLHTAYDAGINFFDNAEGYAAGQAEVVMGDILRKSGWRRSSYLVSSKVFFGAAGHQPNETGLSRKHVTEACHAALKRLQVTISICISAIGPIPRRPSWKPAGQCMT